MDIFYLLYAWIQECILFNQSHLMLIVLPVVFSFYSFLPEMKVLPRMKAQGGVTLSARTYPGNRSRLLNVLGMGLKIFLA